MEEATQQIISTLENQLSQRLEKLWNVFTWCSSILVSITAGVVVAAASKDFELTYTGLVLVSLVIIVVTIYAYAWIKENLQFESNLCDELDKIYKEQLNYDKLKFLRPDKARFGYKAVVIWLGCIAFAATWADRILTITNLLGESKVSLHQ
jgi:Na+/melibiose symporter-like transporter